MMLRIVLIALLLMTGAQARSLAAPPLTPVDLRCEYRTNPQGIEATQPRLTWELKGNKRGQLQTAYQILVAESQQDLDAEQNLCWDSGKVLSDNSILIPYAGKPLTSRMRLVWTVKVWDENDVPSPWSPPAQFSMGLLNREDWSAKWIGYDVDPNVEQKEYIPELDDSYWIWYPEGDPATDAPPNSIRWFRRTFTMPDVAFKKVWLLVSVDNQATLYMNGVRVVNGDNKINDWHYQYSFPVDNLKNGENLIAVEAKNNAGAAALIAKIVAIEPDGKEHVLLSDKSWKTTDKQPRYDWATQDFDDSEWKQAMEVIKCGENPWGKPGPKGIELPPAPYLRKEFATTKNIKRATVYASALGIYELWLNGARVGDLYFTPGWSEYRKRVYYNTYDVTDLLKSNAQNAIGAILADGWYAGYVGLTGRENYGGTPRCCAQLEIEYEDGSTERIVTDESWKATYGDILEADLLMGEKRDFTIDMTGWDQPQYNDTSWDKVAVTDWVKPAVQAYPGAPVRQFENLPAQEMTSPAPGVFVYDLGQNMVGWARIKVKGKAGQRVRVRYAEMLQEDGQLYTVALRSARATDFYTLANDKENTLEPAFTFHGFRYVEITGIDEAPKPEDVVGIVLHADIRHAAEFDSSNPLLNQLCHNIWWGQKGNYLEAPTDCPQRDERLGWTGDAQFFMPTALYTAEIGDFFTKWLVDLVQDSQHKNGSFAHVAPDVGIGGGAVAWGDAAIICPYLVYRFYGDTRVIETHFDNMAKGMDFLENTSENYIRKDLGFGDWLNLGGGAKDEVICTAYFAYLADIMAEMAQAIGREDKAEYYKSLHENIRNAFIESFLSDTGRILRSSQTGYALAFAFDLIPDELKGKAAERFEKEIKRFDWHLATGFIGTPRLLPSLAKAGHFDIAYRLLMNTTYPSWLYQVTLGSTTMWERWNGWTPEKGFENPGMNSFNHYAFGAVGEWIYNNVAGIQTDTIAFKHIVIHPRPGGGLTHAGMTYQSVRGPIGSYWKIKGDKLTLDVDIPANTTATIYIPTSNVDEVTESGAALSKADGITVRTPIDGTAVCEVGSGAYHFEAPAPNTLP